MIRPSVLLPTLLSIPTLMFVMSACGNNASSPLLGGKASGASEDQVAYSLKIEAEPHSLNQAEAEVVAKINAGETVSFKQITMLAQSRQELEYAELQGMNARDEDSYERIRGELETGRERIAAIVPANLSELSPAAIKTGLEDGLLGYFGKPLEYSLEKASTLDPLLENTLQSYSGTMLYNFIARNLPGATYRSRNFVTIFTKGHVQPGYMKNDDGKFHLYGIEMTQAGAADVYFGLAKNLHGDIVVVDADHFLLTELLKGRIKNKCSVQDALVKLTAQKYGIEKPKGLCADKLADANPAAPAGANSPAAKKGKLVGGSLFSFGTPTTPPGRTPRQMATEGVKNLSALYSAPEHPPIQAAPASAQSMESTLVAGDLQDALLVYDSNRGLLLVNPQYHSLINSFYSVDEIERMRNFDDKQINCKEYGQRVCWAAEEILRGNPDFTAELPEGLRCQTPHQIRPSGDALAFFCGNRRLGLVLKSARNLLVSTQYSLTNGIRVSPKTAYVNVDQSFAEVRVLQIDPPLTSMREQLTVAPTRPKKQKTERPGEGELRKN